MNHFIFSAKTIMTHAWLMPSMLKIRAQIQCQVILEPPKWVSQLDFVNVVLFQSCGFLKTGVNETEISTYH